MAVAGVTTALEVAQPIIEAVVKVVVNIVEIYNNSKCMGEEKNLITAQFLSHTQTSKNIILLGYTGCGKSTLCEIMSLKLGEFGGKFDRKTTGFATLPFKYENKDLCLIDSRGFESKDKTEPSVVGKVKSLGEHQVVVARVVLVISAARFTEDEKDSLGKFLALMMNDKKMFRMTHVIITNCGVDSMSNFINCNDILRELQINGIKFMCYDFVFDKEFYNTSLEYRQLKMKQSIDIQKRFMIFLNFGIGVDDVSHPLVLKKSCCT